MHRLLIAAALLLSACGSSSHTSGNAATPNTAASGSAGSGDPDVECHDETPLGSSVPRRVCVSKKDRELDHQGAQDWHSAPTPIPNR